MTPTLATIRRVKTPHLRAEQAGALVNALENEAETQRRLRDALLYALVDRYGAPYGTGARIKRALGCSRGMWATIYARKAATEASGELPDVPRDLPEDEYLTQAAAAYEAAVKADKARKDAVKIRDAALDQFIDEMPSNREVSDLLGVSESRVEDMRAARRRATA